MGRKEPDIEYVIITNINNSKDIIFHIHGDIVKIGRNRLPVIGLEKPGVAGMEGLPYVQ